MRFDYLIMLALMAAATCCGLAVVSQLPWSADARTTNLPKAVGFALGPYILGLATMATLWLFPGAPATLHLALIAAVLLACAGLGAGPVVALLRERPDRDRVGAALPMRMLLWGFMIAVVVDSVSTPLLQNDALEYAMVGRILYEARDLGVYPVLDGTISTSGFYAPWTHPPLYVSLAYAGYIAQGSADTPHVFRLVAPWCLLAATWCTVCLGRRLSESGGILAGVLLISTPMLILGAASAQIDSLALLGLLLAFSVAVSVSGSNLSRGTAIGAALGVALWSHSQAVIFPLLVIPVVLLCRANGTDSNRPLVHGLAVSTLSLFVAVLFAAVPYGRNVVIFGSPISDDPPVFASELLRWQDFFGVQRGLTDMQEVLQFGIFKGFFAAEIFSFTFWIALLGVPLAVAVGWQQRALLWQVPARRSGHEPPAAAYLAGALLVLLAYLAGTALSVALGTDVMIRNERYMLVLMPFAALLAAAGLDGSRWNRDDLLGKLKGWILIALMCALGLQLMALVSYRVNRLRVEFSGAADIADARGIPAIAPIDYLRNAVPAGAVVLALRPADMYYAQRKMVSYLDPRLLGAYAETDNRTMLLSLQGLGITHVQLPDYFLPPVYNTRLMYLLADPQYTELVHDTEGYQIYRLRMPTETTVNYVPCGAGVRIGNWNAARNLVTGSTRSARRLAIGSAPYRNGSTLEAWNTGLLFRRFTVTELASHAVEIPPVAPGVGAADRDSEYMLYLELEGSAYVQVSVELLGPDGMPGRQFALGGVPVPAARGGVRFVRRFSIPDEMAGFRVFIEYRPHGALLIRSAGLMPACSTGDSLTIDPG